MIELQDKYKGHKLVIFSAPSGSGKTTIVRELLGANPRLEFSISATSRPPRGEEKDGVDYHFMSADDFVDAAGKGMFVEWEEVYGGVFYGTLVAEIERLWRDGKVILFDVDVVGGVRLKELFGSSALSIFVMPPSIDELRRRLEARGTDSPEKIDRRVEKAQFEIDFADKFDRVIVNDNLAVAVAQATQIVNKFIGEK